MTASTKKLKTQENLIYLLVWIILFLVPIISMWARMALSDDVAFSWEEVFHFWKTLTGYLIAFVIHNFFIAPILIYKRNTARYIVVVTIFILAFAAYKCTQKPDRMPGPPPGSPGQSTAVTHGTQGTKGYNTGASFGMSRKPPIDMRDISAFAILIFAIGTNLGSKNYFRTIQERRELEDLEKENITQELAYLRYQINPHFFMNTLNNIHALVDINPAKAQDTILELSKMMRFVLYEGDKRGVPLTKEFEFIRNYTRLMQLRYTDKVKISVDLPTEAPDKTVPPLMLITFIENAFKHGVSYQHDSFINIKLTIGNNHLYFDCQNSKAERLHIENAQGVNGTSEKKGGVGLTNVRKRLDLLYDKRYTLDIKDEPDIYTVKLILPL